MCEIWRPIKDFPNYEVSNMGNIKNAITGKLLKPQITGTNRGYYKVNLYNNGVKINKNIHRLVAEAFIPNPENKPEINHINTNGFDNRVENLEWCTRTENQNNPLTKAHISKSKIGKPTWGCGKNYSTEHRNNISKSLKGKYTNNKNPNSKAIVQLNQNGDLIYCWLCIQNAADCFGFQQSHISSCCRGRLKNAYGYKWMYMDDYLAEWWDKEMEKAL